MVSPTPRGEEDGRIIPESSDSVMYVSMASLSGAERLYSRLVGKAAPGSRSIV